jgi:hypothetical protein
VERCPNYAGWDIAIIHQAKPNAKEQLKERLQANSMDYNNLNTQTSASLSIHESKILIFELARIPPMSPIIK